MEKKSNGFLKITGILMIIFGGISIVMGFIAVAAVGLVSGFIDEVGAITGDASLNSGLLTLASWLIVIGGALQLVTGIIGVINAAKPEKAMICIVFGVLVALISVISFIVSMVGGKPDFVSLLMGAAVPALFLIGAFQSKAAAAR